MMFNLTRVVVRFLRRDLIVIWFIIEINIFTFVILMIVEIRKTSISNRLKYFLYQALASVLFLYCVRYHRHSLRFLASMIIVTKIGMAPFHFWFMRISKNINIGLFFWISTIQKFIPLFIFRRVGFSRGYLLAVLRISLTLSVVNLLVQVKLLGVLASSRVFANNWLIGASLARVQTSVKFMIVYMAVQSSVALMTYMCRINSLSNLNPGNRRRQALYLFMSLLLLGGMPPRPLFFIKLEVVLVLIDINMLYLVRGLLVASRIRFYGYININIFKTCLGVRRLFIKQLYSSHYGPVVLLGIGYVVIFL